MTSMYFIFEILESKLNQKVYKVYFYNILKYLENAYLPPFIYCLYYSL